MTDIDGVEVDVSPATGEEIPVSRGPRGLKGNPGREIEVQSNSTHLQWRYVDDVNWTDLVALADLEGQQGDPGPAPEIQVADGFIQWRPAGGAWSNLIAVAALEGAAGASAFEVAQANGFVGTEVEWLASLEGADGDAATIAVGTVTTGVPGSAAAVDNSGTSGAAVLDFTIPEGQEGEPGTNGTGFTGGSYNPADGTVTFTSADGLGFQTGDLRGAPGAPGTDGSVWRSGAGAPSDALGVDGDYYLDTTSADVHFRAAGTYSVVANIAGPSGIDGAGWTGATYDAETGVITFTSDDGLGFATGDLRGADGNDGIGVPDPSAAPAGQVPVTNGAGAYALGDMPVLPVDSTVTLDTVDGDGTFTFPALASVFRVTYSGAARLRLYRTAAGRDADAARAVGTAYPGGRDRVYEYVALAAETDEGEAFVIDRAVGETGLFYRVDGGPVTVTMIVKET